MPERIQRKRSKGWRMPAGARYVGRPTFWGNPYRVGPYTAAEAVEAYRTSHLAQHPDVLKAIWELKGYDLACWCPLDQPCHADVLLELTNGVT